MTKSFTRAVLVALTPFIAACEGAGTSTVDGGFDGGPLADGVASIWVDPDGCQHWYIDDGLEGYMTPRLNRDGTPRCEEQIADRQPLLSKDGTTIVMEDEPVAAPVSAGNPSGRFGYN